MSDNHYGKAMVSAEEDKVTILLECEECGRITIGPIDPIHLRSISMMLKEMADHMGAPEPVVQKTVRAIESGSREEYEDARKEFESMPMQPHSETEEKREDDDAPPSAWED